MQVKMLTSWAGDDITARFGEIIDIPEEIAMAQVEAGNAAHVGAAPVPTLEAPEDIKPAADKKKK